MSRESAQKELSDAQDAWLEAVAIYGRGDVHPRLLQARENLDHARRIYILIINSHR